MKNSSAFFDDSGFSFASLSDGEKRLLDMLGSEDMLNQATSVYDLIQVPTVQEPQQAVETSEVVNDAETPNSSSICTSSNDAVKDDQQSKRSQGGKPKKM